MDDFSIFTYFYNNYFIFVPKTLFFDKFGIKFQIVYYFFRENVQPVKAGLDLKL